MWIERAEAVALLGGTDPPGAFERLLGFGTNTTSIKGVHIMNDLAQSLLGGAPSHGGDLLCMVVREGVGAGEDNADAALRAHPRIGPWYGQAFPSRLAPGQIARVREAVGALMTFDGGLYAPGTQMASALATHQTLLGFEGFRRFRVGRWIASLLDDAGRERLRGLLTDPSDPITRALAPLLWDAPLRLEREGAPPPAETDLDRALGARLSVLLAQPLTKSALLRATLLVATLGVLLKLLGIGRPGGRPIVVATSAESMDSRRALRNEAVQSFQRGIDGFYGRVEEELDQDPRLPAALRLGQPSRAALTLDDGGSPGAAIVAALRASGGKDGMYWPEAFAIALGRRAGCVLPRKDQAGWPKHLALPSDLVEALVMMYAPVEGPTRSWAELWRAIRQELGLVVGADDHEDAAALRDAGVVQISLEQLERNGDLVLAQACRRGVARRLPDSGAEAWSGLQ